MKTRLAAALALLAAVAFAEDGNTLREAARTGDLAGVRAELDRGVKPDTEGRHGLTALMLAASENHIDVARLLVERGADVDARERFFGQTVLAQATRSKRPEMVRWLLEKGSTDADSALDFALQTGDVALAKQALASGHLEPLDLLAYQKFSVAQDSKVTPELRALLAPATVPRPARKPFTADPRRLAAYGGKYGGGNAPEATVTARDNGLAVAVAGQPEVAVRGIAPDLFESAAGDVQISFFGRGGTIEAMTVNRGGDVSRFQVPPPCSRRRSPRRTRSRRRRRRAPWPGPGPRSAARARLAAATGRGPR